MSCDNLTLDMFWSLIGLVFGLGIGFGLGYKTGKKRR